MTTRDDNELLKAFSRGERAALGELAARHERALLGAACALLGGSRMLAGEAVQETWVRVIKGARRFRGDSSVRTWIWRILIRVCTDLRARERKRAARLNGVLDRGTAGEADRAEAPGLMKAVQGLTDRQREVVVLCYVRGLTHAEVCEVLDVPVGTVKSRLGAALTSLRGSLGETDGGRR